MYDLLGLRTSANQTSIQLHYNQGITRPDIRIKVLFVTSVDVGNSNIVIYIPSVKYKAGQ
jgi:hypothetical protein